MSQRRPPPGRRRRQPQHRPPHPPHPRSGKKTRPQRWWTGAQRPRRERAQTHLGEPKPPGAAAVAPGAAVPTAATAAPPPASPPLAQRKTAGPKDGRRAQTTVSRVSPLTAGSISRRCGDQKAEMRARAPALPNLRSGADQARRGWVQAARGVEGRGKVRMAKGEPVSASTTPYRRQPYRHLTRRWQHDEDDCPPKPAPPEASMPTCPDLDRTCLGPAKTYPRTCLTLMSEMSVYLCQQA